MDFLSNSPPPQDALHGENFSVFQEWNISYFSGSSSSDSILSTSLTGATISRGGWGGGQDAEQGSISTGFMSKTSKLSILIKLNVDNKFSDVQYDLFHLKRRVERYSARTEKILNYHKNLGEWDENKENTT